MLDNKKDKFPICNKKKETAPSIKGKTFILCWRCTMVTISTLGFSFLFEYGSLNVLKELSSIFLGIIFIVPMFIDGYIQYFTSESSNNFRRIITGILFGLGVSIVLNNIINS